MTAEEIADSHRPVFAEHITVVPTDEELVLHNDGTGELHLLDRVGTAVATLFDGEHTIAQIVAAATGVFEGSPERISHDIHRLIEELRDRDVLRLLP